MIVALAGRRIDAPDAETTRFPLKNRAAVRQKLLGFFRKNNVTELISSAACGADLLAQAAAGKLKIRRYVILPFERGRFRETSVTDRPGRWGKLFDDICAEAEREGNLIVLENYKNEDEAYSAVTTEILNLAESLNKDAVNKKILAVVVWEGKPKDEKDETAAFAEKANARNIPLKEISTK
jgi:broad specificity phosphatase PhoE